MCDGISELPIRLGELSQFEEHQAIIVGIYVISLIALHIAKFHCRSEVRFSFLESILCVRDIPQKEGSGCPELRLLSYELEFIGGRHKPAQTEETESPAEMPCVRQFRVWMRDLKNSQSLLIVAFFLQDLSQIQT